MKRLLRLTVGWGFVVFGVVGLVLPVLQGILFLAIGFGILAPESAWARRRLVSLRRRYPGAAATFDRAAERAASIVGRNNSRNTGST